MSDRGVVDATILERFGEETRFSVLLVTRTDAERDRIHEAGLLSLFNEVQELLETERLDPAMVTWVQSESQETVDRDHEGNWWWRVK